MIDDPIFIVGTERSGSNLLRLILNSHSHIAVPHPPHVVRYFAPLEGGYGDLSQDGPFGRLVDDVLGLLSLHIYPWDVTIDRARVVRDASPRTAFGVCTALYEQYREHEGKARWACKSTFMVEHTDAILARFPRAKLVLLVRDPRDVAVSSRKSVFSTFHPYFTARLWDRQQRLGLALMDRHPGSTVHLLRYEDLLADPADAIGKLCAFLDEPFEEGMLRFFETAEARKSSGLSESWSNTAKPILKDNTRKFLRDLDDEEVRWIEAVARETMARYGYEPVHTPAVLDSVRFTPSLLRRFWLDEKRLELRTELRSLGSDRNVRRRWARAAMMGYLGVRRGLVGPRERTAAHAD